MAELRAEERGLYLDVRVTSPSRTLLDLAGVVHAWKLERAVSEAFARGLTTRDDLLAVIRRSRGRRGAARLRTLLAGDAGPARTRSGPERALLALIRNSNLPLPETNVKIGPWEVDFLWREHDLVVEVDAYATHSSPWAFERDRRKDAYLADRGLKVRRVTKSQIAEEPYATLAGIRRGLAAGRRVSS